MDIEHAIERKKRHERDPEKHRAKLAVPQARVTSDAIEILERHVIGSDTNLRDEVKEAEFELEVAQLIRDARIAAGLTQAELAKLIGSNQSVLSRVEAADYKGHSLSLLRRIAEALDRRLEISFGPEPNEDRHSA